MCCFQGLKAIPHNEYKAEWNSPRIFLRQIVLSKKKQEKNIFS